MSILGLLGVASYGLGKDLKGDEPKESDPFIQVVLILGGLVLLAFVIFVVTMVTVAPHATF